MEQDNHSNVKIVSRISDGINETQTTKIFEKTRMDFCADLSRLILRNPKSKEYKDLVTFAYFIRKASLNRHASEYLKEQSLRLGWGRIVHITPSNIPINTAFSFIFGFLSGNTNLVRIPSSQAPQLDIFIGAFNELTTQDRYTIIGKSNIFFQSERTSNFLLEQLKIADGRIIWGGDHTVSEVRKISLKAKSIELAFPDRSSLCVIDPTKIGMLTEVELHSLCNKFYNDTLLVDQNACSSPSIIIWMGKGLNHNYIERFWRKVNLIELEKGPIGARKYIDKLVKIGNILNSENTTQLSLSEYGLGATVNTIELSNASDDALRIGLGFFNQ